MKKFEVGAMYWDTSAVDHECVMVIKITRRTEKSVWFVRMHGDRPDGEPSRTKIFTDANAEYVMPYRYSMAPVWEADRKVELETDAEESADVEQATPEGVKNSTGTVQKDFENNEFFLHDDGRLFHAFLHEDDKSTSEVVTNDMEARNVFTYVCDAIKGANGDADKLNALRIIADSIARNERLSPELWHIEEYIAYAFRNDEDVLEAFDLYYGSWIEETAYHFGWPDFTSATPVN